MEGLKRIHINILVTSSLPQRLMKFIMLKIRFEVQSIEFILRYSEQFFYNCA